jgi:O-methyltransferase
VTTGLDVLRGVPVRVGNAVYRAIWALWTRTPIHRVANGLIERLPAGPRGWIERRKRSTRGWQTGLRLRLLKGQEAPLVPTRELEGSYRKALRLLTNGTAHDAVGDYLEFGVYVGTSLLCMHRASRAVGLPSLRLFGFDSFQGLPEETAEEPELRFKPGWFRAGYGVVREHLTRSGIDWDRTVLVPGWYEDTLRPDLAEQLGIEKAGIIMIDCDIYSSARTALSFCAPLIRDRAVIFFDDWPGDGSEARGLGERRAFEELLADDPDLAAEELQPYGPKGRVFLVTRTDLSTPTGSRRTIAADEDARTTNR